MQNKKLFLSIVNHFPPLFFVYHIDFQLFSFFKFTSGTLSRQQERGLGRDGIAHFPPLPEDQVFEIFPGAAQGPGDHEGQTIEFPGARLLFFQLSR